MPASTRQLKTRVRSVKSTRQITKAMQLVAASKMRRSQKSAIITNPYTDVAKQILGYLYRLNQTNDHILFREREVKKRLIIVISSDKGLAGAYNTNILKEYMNQLNEDKKNGIDTETIAVGRKAASFITKLKKYNLSLQSIKGGKYLKRYVFFCISSNSSKSLSLICSKSSRCFFIFFIKKRYIR